MNAKRPTSSTQEAGFSVRWVAAGAGKASGIANYVIASDGRIGESCGQPFAREVGSEYEDCLYSKDQVDQNGKACQSDFGSVFEEYERSVCLQPVSRSAAAPLLPGLVPIPSSEIPVCGLKGLPILSSLLFNQLRRSLAWFVGESGDSDGDFDTKSTSVIDDPRLMIGGVPARSFSRINGACGLPQPRLPGLFCHSWPSATPPWY